MNHCQICGCEMGTPNVVKCTNPILTQGLLWNYNVCDVCARAVNAFIEEQHAAASELGKILSEEEVKPVE